MTQPPQLFETWLADRILEILGKVNTLLTQSDALNAGMAQLSADLGAVAAAVHTEIQQLADAVSGGADLKTAASSAITGLTATHASLTALQTSLAADDPAPPTP